MKVTFIQPYYHNVWDVLGLGYIIAYVKKHYKGELEVNFFQAKFDSDDDIILGSKGSDIVAFSCTSPAYAHGLNLAWLIKHNNPMVHIVFGGWHPTALPLDVLQEDCVDQVIMGEGEHAMLRILDGERIHILLGDRFPLNELPWPNREAVECHRTVDLSESMTGYRMASFQAHRGCPFQCPFCAEKTMTGKANKRSNPIRTRDIGDLLDEIDDVAYNYNVNYFKFVDPTFDINEEYVIRFCREKIKRGIVLDWEALIHASMATEEMFYWLKKAQCHQVNIGCESGSDDILRDIKKGLTTDILRNVFGWAKRQGVVRRAFFLLGMPNETQADIALTEKLIDEIQPDVVGFTILCPYPGTDFYRHETMKDWDWSITDEYYNPYWKTAHFTNEQLKAEQKRLIRKYNSNLCYAQKT